MGCIGDATNSKAEARCTIQGIACHVGAEQDAMNALVFDLLRIAVNTAREQQIADVNRHGGASLSFPSISASAAFLLQRSIGSKARPSALAVFPLASATSTTVSFTVSPLDTNKLYRATFTH